MDQYNKQLAAMCKAISDELASHKVGLVALCYLIGFLQEMGLLAHERLLLIMLCICQSQPAIPWSERRRLRQDRARVICKPADRISRCTPSPCVAAVQDSAAKFFGNRDFAMGLKLPSHGPFAPKPVGIINDVCKVGR